MRLDLKRSAIALMLTGFAFSAEAQNYPVKPIRVVIPFAPGAGIDPVGRMIGSRMSEELGQPVIVDNRAGANGVIGSEFVAKSPPDGYNLLYTTSSTLVTGTFLMKQMPFDVFKDFSHIAIIYETFQAIAVHPGVPAKTTTELIDLLKRNPGKFSYASSGIGSAFHLWGELFQQVAGVTISHVPYKGIAPAFGDLISGRVPISFFSYNQILPMAEAGKMRIISILDTKRYPGAPGIPAIAEEVTGFQKMPSWISISGPAGMPRPLVTRLHGSVMKAANAAEVRAELEKGGAQVVGSNTEQFVARMKADIEVTAKVVKLAGIQPE